MSNVVFKAGNFYSDKEGKLFRLLFILDGKYIFHDFSDNLKKEITNPRVDNEVLSYDSVSIAE